MVLWLAASEASSHTTLGSPSLAAHVPAQLSLCHKRRLNWFLGLLAAEGTVDALADLQADAERAACLQGGGPMQRSVLADTLPCQQRGPP